MPLVKSASKKAISFNIKEMMKAGHPQNQSIAAALSTARKYARKAEGGADLEDPRLRSIGIRPIEGTPDAPESLKREPTRPSPPISGAPEGYQPTPTEPPASGGWGPPVSQETALPSDRRGPLDRAYEGAKHAITEGGDFGISGEYLAKHPEWTPFQPVAAAGDLALRGISGAIHGAAGIAGGVAGDIGTQAEGDRMERDILQAANVAMPEVASPLGLHSIPPAAKAAWEAARKAGAAVEGAIPENAAAAGMGKLTQPDLNTHPQPNEHGEPVKIKNPTPPTPIGNLSDPSKPFTFPVGNMAVPEELNGIPFKPWAPPEGGWVEHFSNYDDPIHETKFVDHPTKQAASGVVILEPDGRMWLTAPTNQFGGYKSTFPKGKLDPGLTMQENAIKEAYEETGLKVRLMGQLADVDKTTSRTRYYLATRESGTPAAMGWESQAAHLVPWSKAKEFLNSPLDHQVLDALTKKAAELKKGPAPEPAKPAASPQPPATKNVPDATGKYFGKYFHPFDLDPAEVKQFKFVKGNHETGGSNPGGVYHTPDGTPVYLKQFEGDHAIERTYNEKLANELLKLAGVPVADVRMTQLKGNPAIASYMVPGKELNTVSPSKYDSLKGLREHYPAHLWTGNYDFVGTGKNNIMVMPDGQTVHIDPGGALRYRAQGKLKGPDMWGPNVEHFDFNKGYDLGQVMKGHLNDPELVDSAKRVAAITDQQIHDLVQQYGPLQKGEKPKLEETLKARRDGVAKMYGVDSGGSAAPPATGGTKHAPKPVPLAEAKAAANQIFKDAKGNVKKITDVIFNMHHTAGSEVANYIANKLPDSVKKKVIHEVEKKDLSEQIFGTDPNYKPINQATIGPAHEPETYDVKALAKHLTKQYKGNPYQIANKLFELKQDHGTPVADAVGAQLTQANGLRQQVGDHMDAMEKADLHSQAAYEPVQYAMGDDREPPTNLMSEDWHNNNYYSHDFNFHGTPWFAKNTKNMFPHGSWTVERIEKEIKAGDSGIFRILDNKQWQDYRPPTQEHPKLIETPNAMAKPGEHGFNRFTEIHHNTNHPGSSGHLEQLFHPKHKKKAKGTQYEDEHAVYALDRKFKGYATYQTGPYLLNPGKVMEAYWPNLREGKTYAETGNHGSESNGALQKKIIEAGHRQGVDLVILHGMNDIGGENQSQYLILNPNIVRAKDAKFDPAKFGKTAKDPATGLDYSNTMWGIAGASAVGAGLMKGQKGEDEKMARGGKVKFKPFSSIQNLTGLDEGYQHKPYHTPKKAKKLAEGGAAGDDYNTALSPEDEIRFQAWKQQNMPLDSGADYDQRGAYLAQFQQQANGHWQDQFKKPNHPTFSDQSQYAVGDQRDRAGSWNGDQFIPPANKKRGGKVAEQEPQDHEFINFKRGGMIESNIPGRTDKIPMKVATGAYVLPADIPSALGQGNTIAGKSILDKMFNSGPYGLPLAKGKSSKFQMPRLKGFAQGGRAAAEQVLPPDHELGMKIPKGGSMCANCSFFEGDDKCGNDGFAKWHGSHQLPQPADEYCCDLYAHHQKMADGGGTDHTPIIAAGGEYIVPPDEVLHQGNGSMTAGHKILDAFTLHVRKEHIKTLKNLKGPK